MKTGTKRWLIWGLVILAIGAALAWALRPQPVAAEFAEVARGPLEVTLDEEGETRVRERYVVSAPVAGRVLRIGLEPGDPVRAGETVLAVFQPAAPSPLDARSRAEAEARAQAARSSLARAEAQREEARARSAFAETELRRMSRLAAEQVVSRENLERAELEASSATESLRASEHAVGAARYELAAARARLVEARSASRAAASGGSMEIRSPIDGVVLRRTRESESVVGAGEPLLEVGDPSRLEIVADYLSADAVQVRAGDAVRIEDWGGPGDLTGTVRRVEPSGFTKISALGVEEQRVNVIIDLAEGARRDESAALADGFRVEVRVVVWSGDDVLKTPVSSLFRHGEGWAVFLWNAEDRAVLRPVDVGHRTDAAAEVLSGLEPGDRVVVHPNEAIADGTPLKERTGA